MGTTVFGVEIELTDHASLITPDAAIGLVNVTSALTGDANAGQAAAAVADGSIFEQWDKVTIRDDNASETRVIIAISGNTLTLDAVLSNTYAVAANGRVDGSSRLRWIQNDVTGLSGWTAGIIVDGGLGRFGKIIDLVPGGNVATPGRASVTVRNTNQFMQTIATAGIYFNGRRGRIYEFEDTTKIRRWSGVCEQPRWDAREYTITLRGAQNKHRANLGTLITKAKFPEADETIQGTIVPLSYGEFFPLIDASDNVIYDSYAKFVRVANKQTILDSASIDPAPDPDNQRLFPVVAPDESTDPEVSYTLAFGLTGVAPLATYPVMDGSYLHVVEGLGVDQYRQIEDSTIAGNPPRIWTLISSIFEDTLQGDADATATDQSWVEIIKIAREYKCDEWPCKAYLDTDGTVITTGLAMFAFEERSTALVTTENTDAVVDTQERQYLRLPAYAFSDISGGENNRIDIDVKQFEGNPDLINSFIVLPVEAAELVTLDNLSDYAGLPRAYVAKIVDGVIATANTFVGGLPTFANLANITDIDRSTALTASGTFQAGAIGGGYALAIEFQLPTFPKRLPDPFDVFIGFNAQDDSAVTGSQGWACSWRRFMGDGKAIATRSGGTYKNLPSFYFGDTDTGRDEDFYWLSASSGYTRFQLTEITNESLYKSVYRVLWMRDHQIAALATNTIDMSLYELALIIRKQLNVKDAIYIPLQGRVFNDTWGGRRTATDLIRSPGNLLEHIDRLQCWAETSMTPAAGWGKGYAAGALINTASDSLSVNAVAGGGTIQVTDGTKFRVRDMIVIKDDNGRETATVQAVAGNVLTLTASLTNNYTVAADAKAWVNGSFDSDDFTAWSDGIRLTRQIQNHASAYSDKMKRSLCRDMFLASWTNKDGFECVKRIVKRAESPTDTITLADITDRRRISIQEPTPDDVFPEPFVRYQENYATNERQRSIRVTNAGADAFDAAYVEGLTGGAAETLWDDCQVLWDYSEELNEPPTWFTDLDWVNGATADGIAESAIREKVNWMYNPVITLPVHYNKVKDWEEAHEFIVQLPHQTDAAQIECRLISVDHDPNPSPDGGYESTVRAIMFKETIPADFDIQDTTTTYGSDRDWEDNVTAQGGDADKEDST